MIIPGEGADSVAKFSPKGIQHICQLSAALGERLVVLPVSGVVNGDGNHLYIREIILGVIQYRRNHQLGVHHQSLHINSFQFSNRGWPMFIPRFSILYGRV